MGRILLVFEVALIGLCRGEAGCKTKNQWMDGFKIQSLMPRICSIICSQYFIICDVSSVFKYHKKCSTKTSLCFVYKCLKLNWHFNSRDKRSKILKSCVHTTSSFFTLITPSIPSRLCFLNVRYDDQWLVWIRSLSC